ncbi:MAG: Na+/H+ antiporter [Phycisphaerales bacterium]|nr:Na+/H+ antiporter [Phycisphaerales bacterium]
MRWFSSTVRIFLILSRMHTAYTLIIVLLTVAVIGSVARLVSIPYPILLTIGGTCLSVIPGFHAPPLDPDLILFFFLPPLLYKEAFHTSWHDFLRWIRPILMLSIGLVALTMFAVGASAMALFPLMAWPVALALGAIVSPTDTVAANSVIHRLRVPRRVSAIVGGESLVNDATGLVALQITIGVIVSGHFAPANVAGAFLWTTLAGMGVGLAVGWIAHRVNRAIRDTTVLFTSSLIAPYAAFAGAHALHGSGVLAVVVAGFFVSWRIHVVSAETRHELYTVWRLVTYVIDAVCFVLIGIEVPRLIAAAPERSLGEWFFAGAFITAVVIAVRIVWMFAAAYGPLMLFRRLREREGGLPTWRNVLLASWCGMRGAVSLAAALSVPAVVNSEPLAARNLLIFCTFCVICGTLLVQGLTLTPLIRLLGIRDDEHEAEEERLARISLIQAALSRIDDLRREQNIAAGTLDHVETNYMERLTALIQKAAAAAEPTRTADVPTNVFDVELRAIEAERERLLDLRDSARINDMTQSRLQEELDVQEMRLRAEGGRG